MVTLPARNAGGRDRTDVVAEPGRQQVADDQRHPEGQQRLVEVALPARGWPRRPAPPRRPPPPPPRPARRAGTRQGSPGRRRRTGRPGRPRPGTARPWARLSTSMIPKTSDSPTAMVNSSTPKATPSTIVMRLSDSQAGTGQEPVSGCTIVLTILPLLLGGAQVVDLVGAVAVGEAPGPAGAVDLLDALEALDDGVTGRPFGQRLVEHGGGVVGLHRVHRRAVAVLGAVVGHELVVGRVVELVGVVQRALDADGRGALGLEDAALGDEAAAVQGILEASPNCWYCLTKATASAPA